MAFTAGVFTPTAIGASLIEESELVASSRMSELSQEIIAGQAILQHQDPNIITSGFGQSCINASVYSLRSASLEKADTTIACAVGGTIKAGTEAQAITKAILTKPQGFIIDDIQCANEADFGKQKAYLGMKAKVGLEVALSQALVAKAVTGIDTPIAGDFETAGAVLGDAYQVTTANFDSDLLADIEWMAKARDLNQPIILNGRNFYNQHILEQYASTGCCTNDAILNANQTFNVYWDAKNVDSIAGAGSTLVIDKNSLLFWSQPVYSNIGMDTAMTEGAEPADRYHWVETLPRLQYFANGAMQPIYVDVRAERSCVTDALGVPRSSWKFEYMLFGALELNMANQDGNQGIYKIEKIA